MHAPDSVEDSYRSEDESGASDDEYVSEFNNKNINHIALYQNSSQCHYSKLNCLLEILSCRFHGHPVCFLNVL